jgi:hydrogenase-4 component B
MDTIADWGQAFFHGHSPAHGPHYFAWANLKSALISVVIGAIIYLFVVRGSLPRMSGRGSLSAWPDLEYKVYRPVLKALIRAGGFLSRVIASLPDKLILLVLHTVLRFGWKPSVLVRPGEFLLRHYRALLRRLEPLREGSAMAGAFSLDLLLVSAGICITLIFVFSRAFG